MKKSSVVLCVVLVILVAVGWLAQIGNMLSTNMALQENIEQAAMYREKRLYQKAIACYETALSVKENAETRQLWIDTYELAYNDGMIPMGDYEDALILLCEMYPENVLHWERLLSFQLEYSDYSGAYDSYKSCIKAGVKSEKISIFADDILYSYTVSGRVYTDYARHSSGYYMVYNDRGWGVINPSGDSVYECAYDYISPYNDSYQALFVSENGQRIANSDTVIEAIIDKEFIKTGAYSDGLLPICIEEGVWRYLDCSNNEFVFGTYKYASNFKNGVAAVFNGTSWSLINKAGEFVSHTEFSDIKLHGNGDYAYDGIMIAAVNGAYGIYDENGNSLAEVGCADMDIYLGGNIAYKDSSGNWGFVSSKGKVEIEPVYSGAKSFSNGLAAVCADENWGYINESGRNVIDCQFVDADYFTSGGMSLVSSVGGEYYRITLRFSGGE